MDWATSLYDDPMFDVENHDQPFAPLEETDLTSHLVVDEWDCSGILHEAEAETEKYELRDGEWVYTGTDVDAMDHHHITWHGDHEIPGIKGSERVKIGIEYSDSTIHTDEEGEPVEMSPGYTLFGVAGTADGQYCGRIKTETYTNLAHAVFAAVQILCFIRDGMLPSEIKTNQHLSHIIEDITGVEPPK